MAAIKRAQARAANKDIEAARRQNTYAASRAGSDRTRESGEIDEFSNASPESPVKGQDTRQYSPNPRVGRPRGGPAYAQGGPSWGPPPGQEGTQWVPYGQQQHGAPWGYGQGLPDYGYPSHAEWSAGGQGYGSPWYPQLPPGQPPFQGAGGSPFPNTGTGRQGASLGPLGTAPRVGFTPLGNPGPSRGTDG